MNRDFRSLTEAKWAEKKFLCVGLDTDIEKIPQAARRSSAEETIAAFNRAIIDATHDIAGFYKPNSAFYEAHGEAGWRALLETVRYLRVIAPDTPVILDAKRADIGNTNNGYAQAIFDTLGFDAVTVHPYLGGGAPAPFFAYQEKGIFVLCRTSNGEAGELQDMSVNGEPLYLALARIAAERWNGNGNCGLVVGATYPKEAERVRAVAPNVPFLIPGVGAQGGDAAVIANAAKDARSGGIIISMSRSIIFASSDADFAAAARNAAEAYDNEIRSAL